MARRRLAFRRLGGLHGIYLVVERLLGAGRGSRHGRWPVWLRRLLVFHCIVLTWLPFRSTDLGAAVDFLLRMFAFSPIQQVTNGLVLAAVLVIAALASQWIAADGGLGRRFLRLPVPAKAAVYSGVAISAMVFNAAGPQPFIYFQF